MSKLEIIVLGMINKNKMYGYEIVKFFKETGFYLWMKIKLPSIYKVLSRLEDKNLIKKKKLFTEDSIPKNEYSITEEGKKAFLEELKIFILKKNTINFWEFIFFTLIMEKSVTKDVFLKAVDIQIEQFSQSMFEKDKKHKIIKRFFPSQNFITSTLGENFKKTRKIHLELLRQMKEGAQEEKNSDYFITEATV